MSSSRTDGLTRSSLFLLLGLSFLPLAIGQTGTTGDIAGVVKDATGAVVANATVTVKNLATDDTRTVTTGDSGNFRITFLKPGNYTISAQTAGLKTALETISVQVGQVAQVDMVANVQATQEIIEVTSQAAAVNTENANLSTTFSSRQVADLPASGGDLTTIAFTVPGIVMTTGGGYGNFSSNGLPGTSNLFSINGNDYNDPYLNLNNSGASNNLLGQNEIQEAAVVQNAYSVQYGRQAGAQVNYTTKSGSNDWHGNLLWNWNGSALNANSFFNNLNGQPRPAAISNQWGDSIGGRVIKDKLFFYADNEGLYYTLPSSGVISIPSPQLQNYILGVINPAQQALYKTAFSIWNGAPGAAGAALIATGNGLTQDNSGQLGCGSFSPAPTAASPNTRVAAPGGGFFGQNVACGSAFATTASNQNREWLMTTRVDWNISDKQKINFRYKHDTGFQPTGTSLLTPVLDTQSVQPQYEGQINHTYIFSPNIVNNFVGSVLYYSAIFGPASVSASEAAFPGYFYFGEGGANGGGFANMGINWGSFPQGRNVGQLQLIDDLSIVKGNHTIKIGENFRKNRVSDHGLNEGVIGSYIFPAGSLSDFVNGALNTNSSYYYQSFPSITVAHIRFYNIGIYAQDEWAAKPNLKLTVGLRIDRTANPLCVDTCFSQLTQPFTDVGFSGAADTPYNQIIQSSSHAYYGVDRFVVDPRVGVVWSPRGSGKTVIRGGIGIFSDLAPGGLVASLFSNAPSPYQTFIGGGGQTVGLANDPGSAAASALASYQAFHNGFANGATYAQLSSSVPGGFGAPNFFSIPQHFETPRYLEYSFEIQQPLGTKNVLIATYAGNRGYNLLAQSPFPNFNGADPAFGVVTQLTNSGLSRYNGLSIAFHRSLGFGFSGEIGYTWAHGLDTISNGGAGEPFSFQPGAAFTTISSPSFRANYSNSDYDIRHNLLADFIWDTPWKFNNRAVETLLGGWTVSSKFIVRTGLPFSITNGESLPGIALLANYAVSSGVNRSCSGANVNTPCFSLSDFVSSQTGFGNVARNSFYGPDFFNIDTSLYKDFAITERFKFRLGASAYNILNHTNFGNPNQDVGSPGGFGQIFGQQSQPTGPYGSFQSAAVTAVRLLVLNARFTF